MIAIFYWLALYTLVQANDRINVFLRAKIRNLIEKRSQIQSRDWLISAYELESQLTLWHSSMSEQLSYTKRNLYDHLVVSQQSFLLFVHVLYHQCRTVLHSSLVPQFSGLQLPETVPAEVTNVSARIALQNAQDISNIGADLVTLDRDPTQIPGFFGYCMYVSASIHIAMLGSGDSTLRANSRIWLISNLKWLKSMRYYWKNLDKLVGHRDCFFPLSKAFWLTEFEVVADSSTLRGSDCSSARAEGGSYWPVSQPYNARKSYRSGPACSQSPRSRSVVRATCRFSSRVFFTPASANQSSSVSCDAGTRKCRRVWKPDPS